MSLSQHHPKHPSHPATPGNINVSQCYPCPVVSQHTHAVMFRLLLFYTESCWIFLRDEIALPEIWKSEFRYSEIASFVLDDLSISVGILVKTLPHLRCVAVFTNVSTEIMIRYAQKADIKSDFHITGQLMESNPEYSVYAQNFRFPHRNLSLSLI